MNTLKTVSEAIKYRRSVRFFDTNKPIDETIVKDCIKLATLAPNSSNLQLWEFYHVTSKKIIDKIAPLCFNQNAAKTAQQFVVIVARKDLWKQRIKSNLQFIDTVYKNQTDKKILQRKKFATNYYQKVIPFIYADFLGIFGFIKYIFTIITGFFRPIYREVRAKDMKVVVHKSAALAAENFMLSMAANNYDTCPMEGFDSWKVKNLLKLPLKTDITMIISCGIRKPEGIYGKRFRVPFKNVYTKI